MIETVIKTESKGEVFKMSEPLKIAICEDEVEQRDILLKLLDESNTKNTYSVFTKGEEFLETFENENYDLILMDIYMGSELTGIETIKLIREKDKDIPVAFVTSSKDHALESYRLSAMRYIEKPYTREAIEDILHLAVLKKNDLPSLFIQRNGTTEKIPFANIIYMEQQTHKVYISVKNSSDLIVYGKLSELSEQLPRNRFVLPHKSFAVNLAYVMYIDMELKAFVMENKVNIPIRRDFLSKAKASLENFLFERTRGMMK